MNRLVTLLCVLCVSALSLSAQTILTADGLAAFKLRSSGQTPQLVDMLMDFNTQTFGQKYDTNKVATDAHYASGTWSIANGGTQNDAVLTNIFVPAFPLNPPIKTSDGLIFNFTPTNGVREDLAQGAFGSLYLVYNFPSNRIARVETWFRVNVSAANQNSQDKYLLNGNPYAIMQFNMWDFNPGGPLRSGMHTAMTNNAIGPSLVGTLPTNMWIYAVMVQDYTNGIAMESFYNATNGVLIFSSITFSDPYAVLQNVFQFGCGYLYTPTITGTWERGPVILTLGNNVPTNGPPYLPNTPSGVTMTQYPGFGNLLVTYTDNSKMLDPHILDLNNGSSWTVGLSSNGPASTQFLIRNQTVGTTYQARVYDSCPANGHQSSAALSGTVTVTNTDVTSGLQAQWIFNNDYSDLTGHGNTGTATGSPTFSFITNRLTGYALALDGTSQYVTVPTSSTISPTSGLTVSAWFNLAEINIYQHLIVKAAADTWSAPYWDYMLRIDGGVNKLQASVNDGNNGATYVLGATPLTQDGLWHMATMTYDGTTIKVYLDGVLDGSTSYSASINASGKPLYIGTHQGTATGEMTHALIEDHRIYNRALTSDEVAQMFYNGARN